MTNVIASQLDFANHHPNATQDDISKLCREVEEYGFNSAFMNPVWVPFARELVGNRIKIGTIVSFPLGQEFLSVKVDSAELYAKNGADELDVSLNVANIKEHKWVDCLDEMKRVVEVVKSINNLKVVKFIPETGYLEEEEIKRVAELILESGADFFKTCSGMGPRGAVVEDVTIVRGVVGEELKIKVAGGISDWQKAEEFIGAGANRIGTSSAIAIVKKSDTDALESKGVLSE